MNKTYLNEYYPHGISMEQRYFELGKSCTKIVLRDWIKLIVLCAIVALIGYFCFTFGQEPWFGHILFVIGAIGTLIGLIGIGVYCACLRYLARAELLYNTRVAGQDGQSRTSP